MRTKRIAFLYDLPHWILGRMAKTLASNVRNNLCESIAMRAPHSALSTRWMEMRADISFFLGEYEFQRCCNWITKPTVLTIQHETETWEECAMCAVSQSDGICVFNSAMLKKVVNLVGDSDLPIFRLDYFIDTGQYRRYEGARENLIRQIGCSEETILLGWSASPLSGLERKGVDRYWELLRVLKREYNDRICLVMFGPNSFQGGWHRSMLPFDIADSIVLIPFQEENQIAQLYSGLDYYLCLSRMEGGPYPLMECMSCGTSVISMEVGVVPEVIHDNWNGFIVQPDNYVSRIAEILRTFTSDSNARLELSKNARASAVAQFSTERAVEPERYTEIVQAAEEHWKRRTLVSLLRRRSHASTSAVLTALRHGHHYFRPTIGRR